MNAVATDISLFLRAGHGGARSRVPDTALGFDDYLRRGIPNSIARNVARLLNLDREALAGLLHVSPTTLDRRNRDAAPFHGAEADALYRVLGVLGTATRVLKTPENVTAWMRRPQPGLGGRVPLDLVETSAGAEAVTLLLEQIYHGIVP